MESERAVAIVGLGAVLPDAPDVPSFWENLASGRYSISDVTDRWDAALYYDPDPKAPDKTYSKIGGWVREYDWNPMAWRMPIPPKVGAMMDPAQRWAVAASRQALLDYGYPDRPLDRERVAVIVGNALGGDFHLLSAARILFPEIGEELDRAPSFQALPADVRKAVMEELLAGVRGRIPDITEDTMPGELGNIVAGRVAALYDFKGPNYIADAACASAMAAMSSAAEGLIQGDYDAVLTGGIDANMSASTYVKFCKIGALSATGSRPFAEGADGFVMGEGAAVFLLKRLADAERDGDKVYAVILGVGGSSDGKGKGITAPNPAGQQLAVQRAWEKSGVSPAAGDVIEGHGTSTKVGDVAELETLQAAFAGSGLAVGSIALGSVKSNIGHLKGGAGAAGVLKAALAIHHRQIPSSVNFHAPNPAIDFSTSPFRVNTELRAWDKPGANGEGIRRAGVSAFGFGGTNFHMVLEEHVPGRHRPKRAWVQGAEMLTEAGPAAAQSGRPVGSDHATSLPSAGARAPRAPLRGALVVGADTPSDVAARLREIEARARAGDAPAFEPPLTRDLRAPVRVAIDFGGAEDLADSALKALAALEEGNDGRWRALRNKGVYFGQGQPGKVAFLFTGQGSQYVGMLEELCAREPVVAATFAEADAAMAAALGGPLSKRIFIDGGDEEALRKAEEDLRQTAVTQPAVLTVDTALARLFREYGIEPDLVMGHSLGEYGALVAADAFGFGDALRAVGARGEAMTRLAADDNGLMAAVFGPLDEITAIVDAVDGYVVVANVNSTKECVIGGNTGAVRLAMEALQEAGYRAAELPVSHAFHTRIVAPASENLRGILEASGLRAPRIPVVANVDASFYPTGPDAPERMVDILVRQIGSPVQFVKGLETLYAAGARVFVEMGPKRALYGMADDVVGSRDDVTVVYTNHPRQGDVVSVNRALCAFYALGLGAGVEEAAVDARPVEVAAARAAPAVPAAPAAPPASSGPEDRYVALGHMFADFLDRSFETYMGAGSRETAPVRIGITGAALGLPGREHVFDEDNVASILRGDQYIKPVSEALRTAMLDRRITRLVKGPNGTARFETIQDPEDVIKLAGRAGTLDLASEFGFPEDRVQALDWVTCLAIAAGIDALRDAGIPLVRRYKTTSTGSKLPVGWALPEEMRDDTAIIFGSAFPGYDGFARAMKGYYEDRARRDRLEELKELRERMSDEGSRAEVDASIAGIERTLEEAPHQFDRRFLFQVLSMGHAQFAEYIGARGPNIANNGACSSGTQAVGLAQDLIRTGRCRRAIVVTADDVTTEHMFPWFASGFLASGSASTEARVEDAAVPFDRRRHGLVIGMGGAALVVEALDAAAERGVWPICEMLGSVVANSAFHGSRLDVEHISGVMETLVSQAERTWGISRREIAAQTVFVSHETYTPARGGSAGAEVHALRTVFGADVDAIVIANTKGYTGHPMGVAIEDTLAVKMLETGIVPPVANYREIDPDLGTLNLSRGGSYPIHYALRLAAGFGSQISMSLLRWTPPPDGARRDPHDLGFRHRIADPDVWATWLKRVTGYDAPELEVVQHTLRVKDQGPTQVATVEVAARRTEVPPAVMPSAVAPAKKPAPAEAPVRASAPAAAPAPAQDPVAARVLQIVSEQTGYPPDMLALDLDLEADLGIDTVKQAEMFAAIRAAYDIERDEDLALRDYPTLARAIDFVYEKRPDLKAPSATAPSATAPSAAAEATAATARVATDAPQAGAPSAAAHAASDPVAQRVLQIVSEQTGYPADMLELDLDLEADLGIDTVKQAEMFAAIRAAYDIERDEDLALRDYPTLARAIDFVYEKRPDLKAPSATTETMAAVAPDDEPPAQARPAPADGDASASATPRRAFRGSIEAAQAVPRREPVASVRPAADRFPRSAVQLNERTRVLIVPDEGGVGGALAGRLTHRGADVLVADAAQTTEALVAQVEAWRADGRVTGVYWLPALDAVAPDALLRPEERREALRRRVKALHAVARALYADLAEGGSFLISATRLGGRHGYDEEGALDPAGGAVTGFTKALRRERPDALVKAVDFEPSRKTAALADLLIEEALADAGPVEVGYAGGHRWSVGLAERPVEAGEPLPSDAVYLVTGAAGSIVSAILTDLAGDGGTFWLLDLAPEPDPADGDLDRITTDREGLRDDLIARLQADGQRVTPVVVERELARIERTEAARAAMRALRAGGATVHYRSLDLRDPEAVALVVGEVLAAHGRVDVLMHAAGLEISRSLPDKSADEFSLVFDVKTEGWLNLVAALGDAPLGRVMAFSSIAGRFGNAGQTDYAAANDLLCKAMSEMRHTRPDTRALAVDWTAWGEIGMAARGSMPAIMKAAGIDMLAPEAGMGVVRRELTAGSRGEVVIAEGLGAMVAERSEDARLDAAFAERIAVAAGPMVGRVRSWSLADGVVVETDLDPKTQPFLDHHRIDGVAVLPGVMGLEAMAEAARVGFPELHVISLEDVDFHAPFKFYRDEPRTVTVQVIYDADGDDVLALCSVFGARILMGRDEPEVTTHFTGTVRLSEHAPDRVRERSVPEPEGDVVGAETIYGTYFHGPAYQVLEEAWRGEGLTTGRFSGCLPPNHEPAERPTLVTPRLVELAFQTAGLAEIATSERMGLPFGFRRLELLRPANGEVASAALAASTAEGAFDVDVVDAEGRVLTSLTGYRTSALPGGVSPTAFEPLKG